MRRSSVTSITRQSSSGAGSLGTSIGTVFACRLTARREAILDAAESLLLERGFHGTSLAAVVERSGGSLATLYAMFKNKQGLLEAVMHRLRDAQLADLEALVAAESSGCAALKRLAERLHAFLVEPRTVAMMRIVMSESLRDPDFGREFYCRGREEKVAGLARMFADWAASGRAVIDDPQEAAAMFLAGTLGDRQITAMADSRSTPDPEEEARRVAWRVEKFCRAFRIE